MMTPIGTIDASLLSATTAVAINPSQPHDTETELWQIRWNRNRFTIGSRMRYSIVKYWMLWKKKYKKREVSFSRKSFSLSTSGSLQAPDYRWRCKQWKCVAVAPLYWLFRTFFSPSLKMFCPSLVTSNKFLKLPMSELPTTIFANAVRTNSSSSVIPAKFPWWASCERTKRG